MVKKRWMVGVAAAAMLAAGCGSSSKSASSAPPANAPKGPPILLGVDTGIQTNAVSQPWIPQAAKVAAAAVNAAGGIQGRPVQIDVCDDHSTPQGASVCAQKLLVQDKVLMMVGDDGTEEGSIVPTLATAHTISWGSLGSSLASLSDPNVYILDPVEAAYWILPQMLPPSAKKVVYLAADSAIAQQAVTANEHFLPKTMTSTSVTVPETATNFQSYCLQVKQSGADIVVPEINPDQVPTMVQTCNQIGLTGATWAITSLMLSPQLVQTVSQYNVKNVVALGLGGTALGQFKSDVAKYGHQVGGLSNDVSEGSINAWLAVRLVPSLVSGAGSLNPSAIQTWLNQQTAFPTMGASAPINFTATPSPQLARLKNLSASKAQIVHGQVKVTVPTPFSAHL